MLPNQQGQQQAQLRNKLPGQQEYVPLNKRRPKLCAELEAAAAARELTPHDVYYDPRYDSYFYAGTLPPTPAAGAAEASVGATGNEIEVFTRDVDLERRSILSSSRRSNRVRRRISFSEDSVSSTSPLPLQRNPSRSRAVCLAVATFVIMLLLCALLVLWTSGYLSGSEGLRREPGDDLEATHAPPANYGKHGTQETNAENATAESTTGDDEESSNGAVKNEEEEKRFKDTRRAIESAITKSSSVHQPPGRRWQPHGSTEVIGDICLCTHKSDNDGMSNYGIPGGGQTSLTLPRVRHCDVWIRCCYTLEDNMTLRMDTSQSRVRSANDTYYDTVAKRRRYSFNEYYSRPQRALVAVRLRGTAVRRLFKTDGQQTRDLFVRNMLHVVKSKHYAGVRFWWREDDTWRISQRGFVRVVRELTTALRKGNFTLGFILPYAERSHPAAYANRLRLLEGVFESPQSLVFYPTTRSMLQKSLSSWTLPSQMAVASKGWRAAVTSSGPSVCYIFLSVTALSVVLSNATASCNGAQGLSTKPTFLSGKALSRLCRSWDSSWMVSRHLYHNFACRIGQGGVGHEAAVVFQTPLQAWKFRRELLAHAHSSCFGFIEGRRSFPRACQFTPLSLVRL